MKVDDQTSDGVKDALLKFTDSFNITGKIKLVVTDNAEVQSFLIWFFSEETMFAKVLHNQFSCLLLYKVMKKAIRGAGFQWFGCIAHTLNLVVQVSNLNMQKNIQFHFINHTKTISFVGRS